MILITNREDIPDAVKVTDVQDVSKLIKIKKELTYTETNNIYIDKNINESDCMILEKFFKGLGVNTIKI